VTTWSKTQIRSARKALLKPLLLARGRTLNQIDEYNLCVADYRDLIIKDNYWRCKSTAKNGNTIDYFMIVEGMSFNQAMQVITSALP